jgi:hypothetical protein
VRCHPAARRLSRLSSWIPESQRRIGQGLGRATTSRFQPTCERFVSFVFARGPSWSYCFTISNSCGYVTTRPFVTAVEAGVDR